MTTDAILAEVLSAVLSELSGIMGTHVVYGISARVCLPILVEHRNEVDDEWVKRFLPPELYERIQGLKPPAPQP